MALGLGLRAAGYQVVIAAGRNFASMVQASGLDFAPIRVDIERFMQQDATQDWVNSSSRSPYTEVKAMRRMVESIADDVAEDVLNLAEQADVFISGLLTVEPMTALARKYRKKLIVGLLAPFYPSADGRAGLQAPIPRYRSVINRWAGYLVEAALYRVLRRPSDVVRARLDMKPASLADFMRAWNTTPTLLGVSPVVLPPPRDWPAHIHTTGYWFTPSGVYQPPPELCAFLEGGPPPVYIGFGSMSIRNPEATTRLLIDAIQRSGQRAIIYRGWAGLHSADLPPQVYMIDSVPHDWLFPRMSAVIHHGGAGTTAAALRAGVPSCAVAHLGDQPYWGRRLHALGVGLPPISRHLLSADGLSRTLELLARRADIRQRAAALGERIRAEDGVGEAVRRIGQILDGQRPFWSEKLLSSWGSEAKYEPLGASGEVDT
jgi:UDP:flavonoid glycosyltransferase YjiC (YdhE family)